MNLDTQLRASSQVARDDVRELDVEAKLRELHLMRQRRRRAALGSGLVAAAAAATVIALAVVPPFADLEDEVQPAERIAVPPDECAQHPLVRCVDDTTMRVDGENPYTFEIPPTFSRGVGVDSAPHSVVVYRKGSRSGVTILTGVRPFGGADARDARGFADWLGSVEFLSASRVVKASLDGMDTWTREVRWRPGVARPTADEMCNRFYPACRPVLVQPAVGHAQSGVWEGMRSRYTFLDVPRLGTVAVWSWAFNDGSWEVHDDLVRTIDFSNP